MKKQLSWLMPSDEKYSDVNLSTSISTLCRDLSEKTSISEMQPISNLEKLRDLYAEEKRDPKNKKNEFKKLKKADQIRAQNAEKLLEDLTRKMTIRPDGWQSEFLEELETDHSVIVFAPTGSGKTFTSIKAFLSVLNTKKKVVYVAPYFYLAFQMLSNMRKVTSKDIHFITEHYKQSPSESNLYIGTARELYAYFQSRGETFDIGIFDEIHTISSTYSDTNSDYYAGLVGMCREKILGLSATIDNSDIERLTKYLSTTSKIDAKKFRSIVHTKRSVPLYKHVVSSRGISNEKRENVPKTNQKYMRTFLEMREKKWLPTLCFQANNLITWNDYTSFVAFVEKEEQRENLVREYAFGVNETLKPFLEKREDIKQKMVESTANTQKWTGELNGLEEQLAKMKEIFVNQLEERIVRTLDAFVDDLFESPYSDKSLSELEMEKMKATFEYIYNKHTKQEIEIDDAFHIPVFTHSFRLLRSLQESDEVTYLPTGKNPFFVFGNVPSDLTLLKSLKEVGGIVNEEINKKRKAMKLLGKAEGIETPTQLYEMMDMFIKGLEYGIGILIPTIPFLLQIEMLRFLSNKYLGIFFASHDMAVGINYPLRSVLICSPDNEEYTYPLALRVQMEGRCGRRGKDTEGHIVYWNINTDEQTLPPLQFPETIARRDMCISEKTQAYVNAFNEKKPYPPFSQSERFAVLSELREYLGHLQENYTIRPSEDIKHEYLKMRTCIHSLRVFSN